MMASRPSTTKRSGKGKMQKSRNGNSKRRNNNQKQGNIKSTPKPVVKKIYTLEELSKMTIPQAIQESSSSHQLLETSKRMWLPSDENLAPHLKTQRIHHEKRIKAASQLLQKLGDCLGNEVGVKFHSEIWMQASENGLKRAILAASIPFVKDGVDDLESIDGKNICMTLEGLHSIIGYTLPNSSSKEMQELDSEIVECIIRLVSLAEDLAWSLTMHEVCQVRWAIKGIHSRIGHLLYDEGDMHNINSIIENLDQRVSKLPFDIIPSCIDWNKEVNDNIMGRLLDDIPFNFDIITTRTGDKVEERRGTAWVAADDIGALAYSGKMMTSHPLPDIVSQAMRRVEEYMIEHESNEQLELCCDTTGSFFDCALCNHYPNEDSACKFHTDPEHGTLWHRLTCVVSAGDSEVRKFAFRPIPQMNEWSKYETKKGRNAAIPKKPDDAIIPAVIPLFPGDVVKMDNECNDLFHHAVYGRQSLGNSNSSRQSDGRVSLVFKKAIDRGNGKKGHGRGRSTRIL